MSRQARASDAGARTAKPARAQARTMAESEYSEKAREFISKEIEHLVEDKGYEQDRAVAAAMDMARRKGYKVPDEEKG